MPTRNVQIEMPDVVFESIKPLISTFKVKILDKIISGSEISMVVVDEMTNTTKQTLKTNNK